MRSNQTFINVYKNPNTKSELVTQLLYGDTFKKLNKKKSWIKIKNNSDILDLYLKNFKYILVDEYQDSNYIQSEWLKLLAKKSNNI